MFDRSTLNCDSLVNKFTVGVKSIFIFYEKMNRCVFRYKSMDEIGKNQDKWVNETGVSSISTDWSMQSISIKSNLPIFIDLSIDKGILIFTDWLLWVISKNESKYLCDIKIWINDHLLSLPCQMEKNVFLKWLNPVFLGGYHPTLKLSGIHTFTFIVSLTYRMDNI